LSWSDLTDDHLQDLVAMDRLHTLVLKECLVTDAGFKLLSQLPALRDLTLSSFNLTDACLDHIDLFPSLQTLDMSGCTNVSLEGVHALTSNNSHLNVIMFS